MKHTESRRTSETVAEWIALPGPHVSGVLVLIALAEFIAILQFIHRADDPSAAFQAATVALLVLHIASHIVLIRVLRGWVKDGLSHAEAAYSEYTRKVRVNNLDVALGWAVAGLAEYFLHLVP